MDSHGQWTQHVFYLSCSDLASVLERFRFLLSSWNFLPRNNSFHVLETRSEENFGVILAYMSSFSTHKFPIQGVQWSLLYLYPNHLANSWPIFEISEIRLYETISQINRKCFLYFVSREGGNFQAEGHFVKIRSRIIRINLELLWGYLNAI